MHDDDLCLTDEELEHIAVMARELGGPELRIEAWCDAAIARRAVQRPGLMITPRAVRQLLTSDIRDPGGSRHEIYAAWLELGRCAGFRRRDEPRIADADDESLVAVIDDGS